jgi:hypothetical protein
MMRLYTDGVFSAEEDISAVGDIDVGSGWFFGSDILGAYSYTGALSEVRFWHGLLSEEAISAWHCSSLDASHPNWTSLQAHWALTEGAGLEVSNSAGSSLNGTVQGAEWNQPEGIITFDYSNTPRIVDVAATALDHMCLTLEPDWNLTGISWVDGCSTTNVSRLDRSTTKTTLYPNPGTDEFQITGLSPKASIEVFDPAGRSVHSAQPGSSTHTVPHTSGRGVYLIRIVDGEQHRTLRWVRQ